MRPSDATLIFSVVIHGIWDEVAATFRAWRAELCFPGQRVRALPPRTVKVVHDTLAQFVSSSGHSFPPRKRKTKVWNRAGTPPLHVHQFCPEKSLRESIKILGSSIGGEQFTRERLQTRIAGDNVCGMPPSRA